MSKRISRAAEQIRTIQQLASAVSLSLRCHRVPETKLFLRLAQESINELPELDREELLLKQLFTADLHTLAKKLEELEVKETRPALVWIDPAE